MVSSMVYIRFLPCSMAWNDNNKHKICKNIHKAITRVQNVCVNILFYAKQDQPILWIMFYNLASWAMQVCIYITTTLCSQIR